jgi:hypothetical protein
MHLIDTGYKFKGCGIFVQTDKPGVTRGFRTLLWRKILEPIHEVLGFDIHDEEPWEDPLERKIR